MVPGAVERQAFAAELADDAGMLALSYRDLDDLDVRCWVRRGTVTNNQLKQPRSPSRTFLWGIAADGLEDCEPPGPRFAPVSSNIPNVAAVSP